MRTAVATGGRLVLTIPAAVLLGLVTLFVGPKHAVFCRDQNVLERRFYGGGSQFGHPDLGGGGGKGCYAPAAGAYAASLTVTLLILALGGLWIRSSRRAGRTGARRSF